MFLQKEIKINAPKEVKGYWKLDKTGYNTLIEEETAQGQNVYLELTPFTVPVFTACNTYGKTYNSSEPMAQYTAYKALDNNQNTRWVCQSAQSTEYNLYAWWSWWFEETLYIKSIKIFPVTNKYTPDSVTTAVQVFDYEGNQLSEKIEVDNTLVNPCIEIILDEYRPLEGIRVQVFRDSYKYSGIRVLQIEAYKLTGRLTQEEFANEENRNPDCTYIPNLKPFEGGKYFKKYYLKKSTKYKTPDLDNSRLDRYMYAICWANYSGISRNFLIDNNETIVVNGTNPVYILSGRKFKLKQLKIASGGSTLAGQISSFKLEGCNDDVNYTSIGTFTRLSDAAIEINSEIAYRCYKLTPETSSGKGWQTRYIELIGTVEDYVEVSERKYKECTDDNLKAITVYEGETTTEIIDRPYIAKYKGDNYVVPNQTSETTYLNWVPWTMPFIDKNTSMYGLAADNNYAVDSSDFRCGAYNNYPLCIYQSAKKRAEIYYAGYEPYFEATGEIPTITFHAPTYIKLATVYFAQEGFKKVEIQGSIDGNSFTTIVNATLDGVDTSYNAYQDNAYRGVDFRDVFDTNCDCRQHWFCWGQSVHIPKQYRTGLKYIRLHFMEPIAYSSKTLHQVIFTGQMLDNADWTDNKVYDWEMPVIDAPLTSTEFGNISVTASSHGKSIMYAPLIDRTTADFTNHAQNYNQRTGQDEYPYASWYPEQYKDGWWQIKFPYKIQLTKLVYENMAQVCVDPYNYWTDGQFFADDTLETPIGNAFSSQPQQKGQVDTITIFDSPNAPIVTDTIFFRKTNKSRYGGIYNLKIEGKRLELTKLDSSNAMYIVSTNGTLADNKKKKKKWGWLGIVMLVLSVVAVGIGIFTGGAGGAILTTVGGALPVIGKE